MFEKLLTLLLHAKAGAISGVFLLGATGALVSVSASNGVTTITVTQPTATATATATATGTATATPTATPTPTATHTATPTSTSSTSSPSTAACADESKALALQVNRVNTAFSTFHTDLMKLRSTRDRATVAKSDALLKAIRQSAVKAIHATSTCRKEDNDEDESHDATTTTTSLNDDKDKDEDNDKNEDHAKPAGLTFTGDATSIATRAITAMQTAFDLAKNAPATTAKPESTHKPEATRAPHATGKPEGHHD